MSTLEQRIVEILDGYFRYSLDVRLDEDIPAAAADIAALVAAVATAPSHVRHQEAS